ncbi:MAG: SDR family NAD(P)-dependent oxidoreductase [Deltaproteobacteria bacterium]|nr:SDR family NAD(P)-dependent oxidoreductase [Deltaproteobacteria bacterium]
MKTIKDHKKIDANPGCKPIAIIGIGCIFPGADNHGAYWANLKNGVDGIREIPEDYWRIDDYYSADPSSQDHTHAKRGGFLSPIDFAPLEFGVPPNAIEATDTSQLLGMVAAKQALFDAGYGDDATYDKDRVSVILGVTGALELTTTLGARLGHPKWRRALKDEGLDDALSDNIVNRISEQYVPWQENSFPGLLGNVVAGRICNALDLGGTNCVVDAACASSFSAIHLASMELQTGRADMVISGGIDTFNDVFMYMCFSKTLALSPTSDAKPFDENADGTILGEGLGLVVLKRLEDAERDKDNIYAVIRALGTSSDGKGKAIYAPSAEGQQKAITQAYRLADMDPSTITLLEAHGTGTKVGDAIEIEAITQVFKNGERPPWCAIGSVKSQIGHTKAAAGAAGLIKAALALHHKVLPPTIKVTTPSKVLRENSPFYINEAPKPWVAHPEHPRRAAVSAFGFGGSNFHCVLEEYGAEKAHPDFDGATEILAISSNTPEGLKRELDRIDAGSNWEDLLRVFNKLRAGFNVRHQYRLTAVVNENGDLHELFKRIIKAFETGPIDTQWSLPEGVYFGLAGFKGKLGFLFSGQGSQYVGMLREMSCQFPQILSSLEGADLSLKEKAPGQTRISDCVYPPCAFTENEEKEQESALRSTDIAQPAIGAVCAGLFKVLASFGVSPDAVAGHSYGELAALFAAGKLDEKSFFDVSVLRGTLMNSGKSHSGGMLAVLGSVSKVEAVLSETGLDVVIANKNAPNQVVLSGDKPDLEKARAEFKSRKIPSKPLPVANAFHSKAVSGAAGAFLEGLKKVILKKGAIPVFSNTTGKKYPATAGAARKLLANQLAKPVDFVSMIQNMVADGVRTFVEVGPGAVLKGLVHSILHNETHVCMSLDNSSNKQSGVVALARVLAHLSAAGYRVDLKNWNINLKVPVVSEKPKMTVAISGVNHVSKRALTPPTKKTSPGPKKEERMVQTIPHVEPGIQPVKWTEEPKGHMMSESTDESMKRLQAGMIALQKLQEETARLHGKFLDGQHAATRMLASLLGKSQPGFAPETHSSEKTENSLEVKVSEIGNPESTIPDPENPSDFPVPPGAGVSGPTCSKAAICKEDEIPKPQPGTPDPGEAQIQSVLLKAICETTGYPVEMLELGMTLDNDLGIDSIKRVEIFSILREKLPRAPEIEPKHLGELESLQDIVDHLAAHGGTAPLSEPNNRVEDGILEMLLGVVSETTGYPVEMLEPEMTLDNDLGIDSIKRVEIFSILREKLPDAPEIEPKHLGELESLQDIVNHLVSGSRNDAGMVAQNSLLNEDASSEPEKSAPAPSHISRMVVSPEPMESAASGTVPISGTGLFWIAGNDHELYSALKDRLNDLGYEAVPISFADLDQLTLPDSLAGLMILGAADTDDGFLLNAFELLRMAEKSLRKAKKDGIARFVTVTFMDGQFGFGNSKNEISPTQGGLAGLTKTILHEWPEVGCLALDMGAFDHIEETAAAIVSEIFKSGPVERGITKDHRITLKLIPKPFKAMEKRTVSILDPDDVVIVSGGARGVTAEISAAVAKVYGPVIVLLGRSPKPEHESDRFHHLITASEIKRAILAGGSGNMTPKELENDFQKVMANREMNRNIERLRSFGAKVQYHRVDIRNRSEVAHALASVRNRFGKITGLIHGAGVLEDRLIGDKTISQFERVYATKVEGLRNLHSATESDDLKMIALFSSSTARFGRKGQIDYAAANEVLNKIAQNAARKRPDCRTVAVNWGPWDGGMVTDALKPLFKAEGIDLIGKEAGAGYFIDELESGSKSAVEVVVMGGALEEEGFPDFILKEDSTPNPLSTKTVDPMDASFELDLSIDLYPILKDHVMNGNAVLPAAMMIEWLAHGALRNNPGYHFVGFNDFRVFKGVIMKNGDSQHLRITASHLSADNGTLSITTEIRGNGNGASPRLFATANVILSNQVHPFRVPGDETGRIQSGALKSYSPMNGTIYNDTLFHGKLLQNIRSVQLSGDDMIMVDLSPTGSPSSWMAGGIQKNWIADPGAIDGGFQAMILWSFQQYNVGSLPNKIGKYRQFKQQFPSHGVRAAVRVTQRSEARAVADIEFLDRNSGDLVARIEDYECTLDKSLKEAFKRHELE